MVAGNVISGVGPLLTGMWRNREELWLYLSTRELPGMSLIYPYINDNAEPTMPEENIANQQQRQQLALHEQESHITILQYYWMSVAIQVHIFQMIFLYQLCSIRSTTTKLR